MRILNWNCNGAFRKKFEYLSCYNADILIIQECENPKDSLDKKYKSWADNYLWIGDSKNKGLGVFANHNNKIELMDWSDIHTERRVKHFLPIMVNDQFQLLAVWTHRNNSPNFKYIGQLWKYLQINQSKFEDIIIVGDFNSNKIWDEWDRWWNHSDVVAELEKLNIFSVYHNYYGELQGQETKPTYFHHKDINKSYHIDYFFADRLFLDQTITYSVETRTDWLAKSDHLPQIFEFKT
jgi:exonuclease III